jgi:hypothetical protein
MSDQLPAKQQKFQLPKIEDLYGEVELASKYNDLNKILNMPPKPEWVKENKFANNTKYIPIERVEYLLTSIFIKWRVEIKSTQVMANSVVTIIRLFVLNPVSNEWDWQDGIGACPIQTAKGAAATDFGQVNTAAVQMAAPASESFALKDAAEKLGKLFGKDLGRKDEINYAPMQENKFANVVIKAKELPEELLAVIAEADPDALVALYEANEEYHHLPAFMQAIVARKEAYAKFAL